MALGEPQSLQEVQLYQAHDSLLVILSHHVSTPCVNIKPPCAKHLVSFAHSTLITVFEIGPLIAPILWKRKLRFREV